MSDATDLNDLWARNAPTEVRVGDVVDATGRALDVQRLIMRRWGWPKLAAKRSAEWLEERFGAGDGYMLPVGGLMRTELQRKILDGIPGLFADLMEGVANRAYREVRDSHSPTSAIEVRFVGPDGESTASILDEGLLTSVVHATAGRLGISIDEFRERAHFSREDGYVTVTVSVDE